MKAQRKSAIAMFGGATAVALTVGLGGVGVSPWGGTSTTTTHSSFSVAGAQAHAAAPGVHRATLAGCISGTNC